ncbi:MAG: VanZ family protein [Proteobacteria bacterium]|nr:VanZ family protein [Pseudomonadota bacterium]
MNIARKYLVLLGWLLVLVIIVLSLITINVAIPKVESGDKIGHFIAYFSLMTWFTWLYRKPWVRNLYAIGFITLGGLLEILQSMTTYRMGDVEDFQVNTIGVIAGFVFAVVTAQTSLVKKIFRFSTNLNS